MVDNMDRNDEHSEVNLLLPWYVNGTLGKADSRRVERHLSGCASCARELAHSKQVRWAVIAAHEEVAEPSGTGLDRILAQIDREDRKNMATQTGWWARLGDRIGAMMLPRPLPAWRLAPVLATLVIAVQSVALVGLLVVARDDGANYQTLSGPEAGILSGRPRLVIAFHQSVTESALREALHSFQGNIIQGPTAAGGYIVEITKPLRAPEEIDRIIDALRAKSDLVRLVEKAY